MLPLRSASSPQDNYVSNVADVIKVGDTVRAKVLSVDVAGNRLALTRKGMGVRAPGGGGGRRQAAAAAAAAEEEGEHMAHMRMQNGTD